MSSLEVIVVEDNELDMLAVTNALTSAGVKFITISDSTKAMEAAIQHQPELAILDYRMPEIDGISLCRQMASDPRTAHIDVMFLSASDNIDDHLLGAHVKHIGAYNKSRPILELINGVVMRKLRKECAQDICEFQQFNKEIIERYSAH